MAAIVHTGLSGECFAVAKAGAMLRRIVARPVFLALRRPFCMAGYAKKSKN